MEKQRLGRFAAKDRERGIERFKTSDQKIDRPYPIAEKARLSIAEIYWIPARAYRYIST